MFLAGQFLNAYTTCHFFSVPAPKGFQVLELLGVGLVLITGQMLILLVPVSLAWWQRQQDLEQQLLLFGFMGLPKSFSSASETIPALASGSIMDNLRAVVSSPRQRVQAGVQGCIAAFIPVRYAADTMMSEPCDRPGSK